MPPPASAQAGPCTVTAQAGPCTVTAQDEHPDVFRFTASVFPSEDDDVITSPYNAMLSAAKLVEHADCVLPIENQALIDICNRCHCNLHEHKGVPLLLLSVTAARTCSCACAMCNVGQGMCGCSCYPQLVMVCVCAQ